MANDDENAFKIGPLSDEVRKAAPQIRLLLTYVRQTATQDALAELCRKTSFSPCGAKQTFCYNDKEHFEDIRRVGRSAPLFKQLVGFLRKINDESIILEKAIPGDKLVDRIVADYHDWVEEQSKR